ncbi:MAG: hypothetical protein PQJ46_07435, partial [Spirochaetales bacterium]|nr:hypothetical protein [Spirochaetales bacterium]
MVDSVKSIQTIHFFSLHLTKLSQKAKTYPIDVKLDKNPPFLYTGSILMSIQHHKSSECSHRCYS